MIPKCTVCFKVSSPIWYPSLDGITSKCKKCFKKSIEETRNRNCFYCGTTADLACYKAFNETRGSGVRSHLNDEKEREILSSFDAVQGYGVIEDQKVIDLFKGFYDPSKPVKLHQCNRCYQKTAFDG